MSYYLQACLRRTKSLDHTSEDQEEIETHAQPAEPPAYKSGATHQATTFGPLSLTSLPQLLTPFPRKLTAKVMFYVGARKEGELGLAMARQTVAETRGRKAGGRCLE